MPKLEPLWALDPLQYLLLQRFPMLSMEARAANVGSNFDPLFDEKLKAAALEAKAYREELEQLSKTELHERVVEARKQQAERAVAAKIREEEQRFYNRPENAADFRYWAKLSMWSLDEIVALSLGRDPSKVNWANIQQYVQISPFAQRYQRHRNIVVRARAAGQLFDHTYPSIAIAWALRMKVDFPEQLVAEVEALGIQIADWKSLYDKSREAFSELQSAAAAQQEVYQETIKSNSKALDDYAAASAKSINEYKELLENAEEKINKLTNDASATRKQDIGPRERDNLLRLIIGMAIDAYGYDVKAQRSPLARELSGHLQLLGLSLSDDTIRKYLDEAKELLPRE